MENDLEKYLHILNSDRCLRKPKEAVIIIHKISDCFKQEQSQFTIGLLIGLVLDENAIFSFIWKTCSDSESVSSAVSALKLLDDLVTNFQQCTEPYFSLLFEKFLYLLDTKFAKVKELSLKLIKTLIVADSKNSVDLSKLIVKLEKHLREENKIPGTVLEEIYCILGHLFEKYPESLKNEGKWFFDTMCETLRHNIKVTKNPALSKIRGAFEGINGYLVNYPPPDKECAHQIYEYMKVYSKWRQDKRLAGRSVLKILQNHRTHFSKMIYNDRDFWKSNLAVWIKQSPEDRQSASYALNSFYSVITFFLKQEFNSDILNSYLNEFTETLSSSDSNASEKRSALTGIKLFVLTNCLKGEDFNSTYEVVMNFIRKQESFTNFNYLPLCIECVSAFTFRFTTAEFHVDQLSCLQRLSVKIINEYPSFDADFQPQVLTALEKSFYMLGLCNLQVMETHIDKVLYQGLIRSVSLRTVIELELLKELGEKEVDSTCYKSFISLWKYLLNLAHSQNRPVDGSFVLKKGIALKVFDAFIDSFLRIVTKLNLKVDVRQNSDKGMEIEKPSDLNIFINCVDLYQDLIPLTDCFYLFKWLAKIFQTLIHLSYKNPLVAGFYKLITTTLNVADRLQFFEEKSEENKKLKCFELVSKFLEDLLMKVDQYKGDLQVACLKTLLAAPVKLIEHFMEKTIPALEVIIHIGHGHFPLLKDLVEALERWDLHLPSEIMIGVMRRVLPHFDVFFQNPYFRGNNLVDSSIDGKKLKKKLMFNDSELLTLQKQFLMFLGHTNINKALNLIEFPDSMEEVRVMSDKHLIYQLPFGKGQTEIILDEILVRVMDLAVSCSDRKTRITTCEFLYSAVMIVLSNINQLSGGYTWLFRKIIKTCLILGCDSDNVVCQIYEPLMYQITHYFSGKKALHFSETKDLIDILMDSVTRPYDPAIRDFAALLICEFTVWSIKQLTAEELKETPDSIKRILSKVYSLAQHPSYNKRIGAAVVFNKIYSVLREEDFILEAYWFQLYYYFMESLRMCDGSEDVAEINEAIKHIKRPLLENHKEFNKSSPQRVVPPEFEGNLLCHLLMWTMKRCHDLRPSTRKTAMTLVQELAPLVAGCDSLTTFIKKYFPKNSFLFKEKKLEKLSANKENLTDWLRYQCATFEYYNWLLDQKVMSAEEIIRLGFNTISKSYVAEIIKMAETPVELPDLKHQSVLLYLNLLFAMRERAFCFPVEVWHLLQISIFAPSELGFDLNHITNSKNLFLILTDLLKFFSSKLVHYDWNYFYENLETVITAPLLSYVTKKRCVNLKGLEFLFALKVIESSGIWEYFMSRMLFSVNGGVIVKTIFRSLFFKQGKHFYTFTLEPSCKCYLEEFLTVTLRDNQDLDNVLSYIKNTEDVREEETGKIIKKGDYFLLQFKNAIFKFLESKPSVLVERVVSSGDLDGVKLLIQILENMKPGDPEAELPKEIFRRWEDFEKLELKNGSPKQHKRILLHFALSGAQVIGTPGFLKVSPIADKICSSLENEKFEEMNGGEIEGIFGLFPFLSVFGEGVNENDKLDVCLSKFKVDEEALRGSGCHRSAISAAINGFLRSLKSTASLVLLRFMISKASWFEAAAIKEDIESALEVFADIKTPLSHSVSALRLVYTYCFESQKISSSVLLGYTCFFNPLMRILPREAVQQVILENLYKLCDLITSLWDDNVKNLSVIATDLRRKICAAKVLQAFINKLTKEELDELAADKKNLIDKIPGRCFPLLKQAPPGNALKERYRKFMCEVFNMICSIICARCTKPKFYKLFIFDERGSFLYAAVDNTIHYNLSMDFDEIPKRKKQLTFLRKNIAKDNQRLLGQPLNSVKYIQTNTLFTSSLQEDVTQFDLTYSPIRPLNSIESLPKEPSKHMEIELEMDALNGHECMTTLVGVISKMVKENLAEDNAAELPCWLTFFLGVLKNSKLSKNMKLFVLKAIYNVQDFVQPFCQKVFPVILDSILNLFANYPINYFLIDLIEMMIGWKELPKKEISMRQLTSLVRLVLEKCDSLRSDIVKNNLEVIKMMIELWKDSLCLSDLSFIAFERLVKSVEKSVNSQGNIPDGDTYLNVQICGVLLANGIPPWKESCEKEFFNLVFKNFLKDNKKKEICGEICGLALMYIENNKVPGLEDFEEIVRNKISSEPVYWVPLLYGVHKHYPKMSSMFIFKIFSSAWDSADSLSNHKLEMLLSHVSREDAPEDDSFNRHVHVFLIDMLNCADVVVQETSLQMAEKLVSKLNEEKLQMLLREVLRLQKSIYPGVRKWVYEIAMKCYIKCQESGVKKQCKIILLKGLNDGVKSMEEACLKFWCNVIPFSSPYLILMHIFQGIYTPEIEDIFLSITAKILIQSAAAEKQCEMSIFPHPIIHQSKFQKRSLILGLRSSALLTTNRTWKNQSLEVTATQRSQNLPFLRSTMASLKFQPTLLVNSDEVAPISTVSSSEDSELPRNPYKVRFYKSAAKTNFSFKRKQKQKKKRELLEEEELTKKKETEVQILGEYRIGDYPDIQISHFQILRPLEALAKVDHEIARQFLVAFYSGLMKMLTAEEKTVLFSETNNCFENILKSSKSFDPGVFGFVLEVFQKHSQNLDIDCELISNAAVSSNWLSLGALIIEQSIARGEDCQKEGAKRRRGSQNPEGKRWLELAKLYRALEEFDVLSGILLDKLNVAGDAKKALHSEALLDWATASVHYESILQTDPGSHQSDFYTESYFLCLAKLSNWSLLNKCIRTTVDQNLDELWKNYNLLFWFLKSEMMISLGSEQRDVQNILEEFCKSKSQLNVLSTNFGEELAVFDWLLNKLQRANYRIDRLCLDFLAGWSHLNRWSYNLRAAKLSSLQTLSELSFAVRTLAEGSKSQLEENVKVARKRWQKSVPSSQDDLTFWDVKLGYRREFIKRLKDFDLTTTSIESDLELAKAALAQDNLSLTKECLSRVKQILPEGNADLKAEYEYCFNLGKMLVAGLKSSNSSAGCQMYMGVWRGIDQQLSSAMDIDSAVPDTRMYKCNFTLGRLVSSILPLVIAEKVPPEILKTISLKIESQDNVESITEVLKIKGVKYFEAAADALERSDASAASKSNTYLELAKFILKFSDKTSPSEFQKFCKYLLTSMRLGSTEARQLFGSILNQHSVVSTSLQNELTSECDLVPSWMFLMWINQMLASLNSNMFPFLKSIIFRVAQEYPNSIRYAFWLNKEEYESRDGRTKSFLKKLDGLFKDRVYENFCNSLKYLVSPDLIIRHHLENALQEVNQEQANYPGIRLRLSRLFQELFSPDFEQFRGSIFKFCEKFKQPLEELLTIEENKEVCKNKISDILSNLEVSKLPSRRALRDIESYSPWLHNFHALKVDTALELPGQYGGTREPITKNLVTVSSFRSEVVVFNSKCRPMKITVLGNDAIEHSFLIKFGEDLRQDERIQQVFEHFNYRLKESKQTRRFYLQTYKVIPLTVSLGMIEWIENNVSLYEMIENSLGHDTDEIVKAQSEHLAFLSQNSNVGPIASHLIGYEKIKRDLAISNFNVRVHSFSGDLLKKAFLDLSTSPEHFMHLRGNFATSHAVMCITHWLVGIGDRHLQNILVSTKTGRVLGIDFGYAFGFATQLLVPPELIPFRLTPQILNLTDPLNESGWIKQTMVHCLRHFRKEHVGLSSILEVFVLEPVMDWLKQAKKSDRYETENSISWFPRHKIAIVEKKLKGTNPVAAFEADLTDGHAGSKYLGVFLEVLKGIEQHNIRARYSEDGLTEEEQVECLIDLATDPHVLSKTYVGWNPWI